MRAWWLALLLLGCSKDEPAAVADTGVEEEEDTLPPLPELDPSKCGSVAGDEAPLTFDRSAAPAHKIFPLFVELDAEAARLAALKDLQDGDDARFTAAATCADAPCVIAKTSWSDADIAAAAERTSKAFDGTTFATTRLRPSGAFNLRAEQTDGELIAAAVIEHMKAARSAISAFAAEVEQPKLIAAVNAARGTTVVPYYQRTRALALAILTDAGREQATLYEPLDKGENAAALAAIPSIEWSKYPFAAIVVPGLGPTDASPLAEGGRIRADMAAQRYQAKLAPLVLLSGGHVHPDRTKYSEAIEMKRYLREKHGLPESALIVDPHARHTTTNLRNASRLLLRYGVPPERPIVVNTDMFQSVYMIGPPFAKRCREEIGYEPWRKLVSLSTTDTCLLVTRRSLHIGPSDPRDP